MASDRRTDANRRNAKKSTGPTTAGGKARISRNAMKHGLAAAKHFVLPGEDLAKFAELDEALFDELAPATRLEAEYVRRIVTLLWRMRRIPELEAALLVYHEFQQRRRQNERAFLAFDNITPNEGEEARRVALGEVVNEVLRLGHSDKLSRYEASLRAQFSKSLQELKALQQARVSEVSENAPCLDGAPDGHLLTDESCITD